MTALGNPRVLLSPPAMEALEKDFGRRGEEGKVLFTRTVEAIRTSMEAGVRSIFWIAAITMLLSFLLILTVPEISLDSDSRAGNGKDSRKPIGDRRPDSAGRRIAIPMSRKQLDPGPCTVPIKVS